MELLDRTRGPLPGSVTNHRKFVIQYMRSHGFEVKEDTRSEYPEKRSYYLRGELVGWSYDNIIYLYPVLPSLVKMGILSKRMTEIPFDWPGIEMHKRLKELVNELKNSNETYDDLIKGARAKKVRDYFKYRDIAKRDVREYNKLMKGLMGLR